MAFAATKGAGNAVARHRHVRKLREFYRHHKELFAEQTHYFLLVRAPVEDWDDFEIRLKILLHRAYALAAPPSD